MPEEERQRLGKAGMLPEESLARAEVKLEKELQRDIGNVLRLRDIFFGCQRMDRKSNIVEGYPDFWFVYRKKPIALEVKVGANKQTPKQVEAQRRMEADGWRYKVVRSIQEVMEVLNETL
jgi:hypothetical protein